MPVGNKKEVMTSWKKSKITADGLVSGSYEGCIFGGILLVVAGTSTTFKVNDCKLVGEVDDSGAGANLLFPVTTTLTAGQFVGPTGGVEAITSAPPLSAGIVMDSGIYVDVGGTGNPEAWVFWR